MATLKLRDRDAIVTKEDLIFRVFGYDHPPDAYICDLEYAPKGIFNSSNPRAPRGHPHVTYYKLYEDEAWTYLKKRYPQYLIPHAMLQRKVIGVRHSDIAEVRRPQEKLKELLARPEKDELLTGTQNVLGLVTERSGLRLEDFGVFGSMLHDFHHPKISDIDLTVYGRKEVSKLCETLRELYADASSPLRNEFETERAIRGKRWRFRNLSPEEYVWHQQRKMIYALFKDKRSGRTIKTEFEPVKDWKEISNEYNPETTILSGGWIKMKARATADEGALFVPSVYSVEPVEILTEVRGASEVRRIVSYVEEFRMQVGKDELICVEGNLEKLVGPERKSYQVVLTCCSQYYNQTLKVSHRDVQRLPGWWGAVLIDERYRRWDCFWTGLLNVGYSIEVGIAKRKCLCRDNSYILPIT